MKSQNTEKKATVIAPSPEGGGGGGTGHVDHIFKKRKLLKSSPLSAGRFNSNYTDTRQLIWQRYIDVKRVFKAPPTMSNYLRRKKKKNGPKTSKKTTKNILCLCTYKCIGMTMSHALSQGRYCMTNTNLWSILIKRALPPPLLPVLLLLYKLSSHWPTCPKGRSVVKKSTV